LMQEVACLPLTEECKDSNDSRRASAITMHF